jgi:hypothetical protein
LGFAASTLVAYALTRTCGLLGFQDDHTLTEAVIAVAAEVVALAAHGARLVNRRELHRIGGFSGPGGVGRPHPASID